MIEETKCLGGEKLTLYVGTENYGAVKMYKNLGFVIEGTTTKNFRTRSGAYKDTHLMALDLSEL